VASDGPSECRDCGEPAYWFKTFAGKSILVDPNEDGDRPDGVIYDRQTMTCHFDTCQERKPRPPTDDRPVQGRDDPKELAEKRKTYSGMEHLEGKGRPIDKPKV